MTLELCNDNASVPGSQASQNFVTFPPGILGEIAEFILAAAPYPNRKIALAGAILLLAGIVGRSFNVSGSGLNIYLMLMAATGVGKDAMASGTSKLMAAVVAELPGAAMFQGPGYVASPQALQKSLAQSPCQYQIIGEAGIKLESMTGQKASAMEKMLIASWLDIYSKSGRGLIAGGMAYSDQQKDIRPVISPSLSLGLESTPATINKCFNDDALRNGLVPRFLLLNAGSMRGTYNENAGMAAPPPELVQKLIGLCTTAIANQKSGDVQNVAMDEGGATTVRSFRDHADYTINQATTEAERHLYSRAALTGLKLAALASVGINPHSPVIDRNAAHWAFQLVEGELLDLLEKIANGETGNEAGNQIKQEREVLRVIREYANAKWAVASKYHGTEAMHRDYVITGAHISQRLFATLAFREDGQGATYALNRTIKSLLEADIIREIPRQQMIERYGKQSRAYGISDPVAVMKGA
jgi:hypothetical protein